MEPNLTHFIRGSRANSQFEKVCYVKSASKQNHETNSVRLIAVRLIFVVVFTLSDMNAY